MSSETSRRVSSTACWSISRVDSGRSASTSSGSSASGWRSRPRRSPAGATRRPARRAGRPGASTCAAAEGQRAGHDAGAARRPARAASMTVSAKTRPIDARPGRSRAAPIGQRDQRAPHSIARRRDPPGAPAPSRAASSQAGRAPPGPRRLRSVSSSSWAIVVGPLGMAPAPRRAPPAGSANRSAGPSVRATETRCSARSSEPRRQHPAQVQRDHRSTLPSRASPASAEADQGERVRSGLRAARISPSRRRIASASSVGQVVVAAEVQQAVDDVERQLGPGSTPDVARPWPRPSRPRRPARRPGPGRPGSESGKLITSVGQSWPRWRRLIAWIVASSTRAIEIEARAIPSAVRTPRTRRRRARRGRRRRCALGVADLDLDRSLGVGRSVTASGDLRVGLGRHQAVRCSGYLTRPW